MLLLLLPVMTSACELTANCLTPSWEWPSLLKSCAEESTVIHPCNIRDVPPFVLESFPSSSLAIPHCTANILRWQSLFTAGSQLVDISSCPLQCSCDTVWIGNYMEHLHVKPPRNFFCNPSCPLSHLSLIGGEAEPELGRPFIIEYKIIGEVLAEYLNTTRFSSV